MGIRTANGNDPFTRTEEIVPWIENCSTALKRFRSNLSN